MDLSIIANKVSTSFKSVICHLFILRVYRQSFVYKFNSKDQTHQFTLPVPSRQHQPGKSAFYFRAFQLLDISFLHWYLLCAGLFNWLALACAGRGRSLAAKEDQTQDEQEGNTLQIHCWYLLCAGLELDTLALACAGSGLQYYSTQFRILFTLLAV